MTDPDPAPAAALPAPRKAWLVFTEPGCRTELRVGALLVLAGTFLWNFAGPALAMKLAVLGLPLLAIGTVLQVRTPAAFPWRMGLAMLLLGGAMCWDFRYRDAPGTPVSMLLIGPILASAGAWLLLWWPVALVIRRRRAAVES